ncbi:XRCC4-like factor-domain-containing protein [Paraphoma chrysanthemicola]|uniref:Non-homologous end-joining factor 1 n=1 Tax=Paraphoma chrysanthemicola TaxID=798071 RepID=A0A8K0RDA8_9PLEO|nr:XRCC4-like factor-domain-containing protein [Paraphoma chrysanthemicola]
MSGWRVLQLSEQPDSRHIPQLLVKPDFRPASYTVHLTCLSNIWSEQLDLDAIVTRASQEQSPIEVSKHDTAQLAILLDNVKKSLEDSDGNDTVCSITRTGDDDLTLHTTIALPKPLDSLTWKFHLTRQPSTTLKNELILPLLISSHIQHERISGLVSTIKDKDRAITRLVDQYESSNLDLAAAFPVISGLKSGRRVIKREQAAKHVPALQPFREDAYREETAQLSDPNVSTLGLFQQALSECHPEVPSQLKSNDGADDLEWWSSVSQRLSQSKPLLKSKPKAPKSTAQPQKETTPMSDEETEDEFETHENFKTRAQPVETNKAAQSPPKPPANEPSSDDDATEDEDDLDAPIRSQSSQPAIKTQRQPPVPTKSPSPDNASLPEVGSPPRPKPRAGKGFRIGGKAKAAAAETVPAPEKERDVTPDSDTHARPSSNNTNASMTATPPKIKRNFMIGGKSRTTDKDTSQGPAMTDRTRATLSPSVHAPSSPPMKQVKEESPVVEEEHEETPEEKAERKRAELKRKTEEAAKKQAQSKKKRRF